MKNSVTSVFLLITFAFCTMVKTQPSTHAVITGATLIDGTGRAPLKDAVIVIAGNRIKQIGAKNKIDLPKNAQLIDAAGKYIIPGLADMHMHPGDGFWGQGGAPNFKRDYMQMLAWGVTTVFSPLGPGLSDFAELKNLGNRDDAPMPRFFGVGSGFTSKDGHAAGLGTFMPEAPNEAREKVRELKSAGVDAVKLFYDDNARDGKPPMPVLKPEVMRAIIDEAHIQDLKVYAHATSLSHAKEVLRAGADGLVHSIVSEPIDAEFIGLMKKNRAVYITTLALFNAFVDITAWVQRLEAMDERATIPKAAYERFKGPEGAKSYYSRFSKFTPERMEIVKNNLRKAHQAGILVVAGTDTGVPGVLLGVASQTELVLLAETGLKVEDVLQTATINAAKMLGREREQGTVETGKVADLVILDADPLTDIKNIRRIHRVLKAGIFYDPAELLQTIDGEEFRNGKQ
jgi:imidazolonepropionase-like amidohydrolase